jgi:hypothetical protein
MNKKTGDTNQTFTSKMMFFEVILVNKEMQIFKLYN